MPGQKRWTIPDNWEMRVHSKRDTIAYGLYYIPESDVWAKVSIPTNDRLSDAWYCVKAVGGLAVEPVGGLGSSHEVRQLATEFDDDGQETVADALREVANNWDVLEEDLYFATEWVRDEGIDHMQPGDQPIRITGNWEIEFHHDRIFRPAEALGHELDLPEDEISVSVILDELQHAGLLSDCYKFELTLDKSAIGMEYYIRGLIEAGTSPVEAVDYYMTDVKDLTQTAWADERGVGQSTVSENVSQARKKVK